MATRTTTPIVFTSFDVQTLCHPAYRCLTPFFIALSRSIFFDSNQVKRTTFRSFSMQLSKKTAMLFFLYLNAAFTPQTEIFDAANTSGESIRAPKNDLLDQSSGNISDEKLFQLRECDTHSEIRRRSPDMRKRWARDYF